MSKYDSAFKADGNGNLLLRLEAALVAPLRDIDARLNAGESRLAWDFDVINNLSKSLLAVEDRLKEVEAAKNLYRYPKFTVAPGEGLVFRKVSGPHEDLEYEVRQDKPAPPEPAPTDIDLAKRAARALGDPRVCVSSERIPGGPVTNTQAPLPPNTHAAPTAPATREPGWYWTQPPSKGTYLLMRYWDDGSWWLSEGMSDKLAYYEPTWIGPRIEVPKS